MTSRSNLIFLLMWFIVELLTIDVSEFKWDGTVAVVIVW